MLARFRLADELEYRDEPTLGFAAASTGSDERVVARENPPDGLALELVEVLKARLVERPDDVLV